MSGDAVAGILLDPRLSILYPICATGIYFPCVYLEGLSGHFSNTITGLTLVGKAEGLGTGEDDFFVIKAVENHFSTVYVTIRSQ